MSGPADEEMMMTRSWSVTVMRWSARIVGTGGLLLMTAIAVGEGGPPNPYAQPLTVCIELHLMFAMWLGMLLAWKWEGLGGALMLGGTTAFCMMERKVPNALFGAMLVCGALYLACWLGQEKWEVRGEK